MRLLSGSWPGFENEGQTKREEPNLDISWMGVECLGETESPTEPDLLAQEIADGSQASMEQFAGRAD